MGLLGCDYHITPRRLVLSVPNSSFSDSCVLVSLLQLIDEVLAEAERGRCTASPVTGRRGRPLVYPEALFYKALVIMIVRRLTTVHEFCQVINEPTPQMQQLRSFICGEGPVPCARTWQRRLRVLPSTLPQQIHLLGSWLLEHIQPFDHSGRAVAIDSTLLKAFGGFQWHKKDKDQGQVPHPGIDIQAGWSKSGHHGWVYGWKLHVVVTCGQVWIPLAARLTCANTGDGNIALQLLPEVAPEVRFVLGDTHYNTPSVQEECFLRGQTLVASGRGRHPRRDTTSNSPAVRALFHKLRSMTVENFNEQFKTLFDAHRSVPTKGLPSTQLWILGAVWLYQLLLRYRFEHKQPLRQGLKYALHAA